MWRSGRGDSIYSGIRVSSPASGEGFGVQMGLPTKECSEVAG